MYHTRCFVLSRWACPWVLVGLLLSRNTVFGPILITLTPPPSSAPSPGMLASDIMVCREHAAGVVSAGDYNAPRQGLPELDAINDWRTVASGRSVYSAPPAPLDACPAGWTWGLNRCWKVLPETKGWDAGKTTCEAEGGGSTLAKISTEAENRFVAELGVAQGESRPLLWLGAKETGTTMKYTWVDGAKTGAPLYTAWLQNQPNRDDMGHAPTLPECLIVGYQKTTETYNKALDTGWISSDCRTSYYSTRVPTLPFKPRTCAHPYPLQTLLSSWALLSSSSPY